MKQFLSRFALSKVTVALGIYILTSCHEERKTTPPVVPVTDTKPLGEGLKVIGYGILGSAVVLTLGRAFAPPLHDLSFRCHDPCMADCHGPRL